MAPRLPPQLLQRRPEEGRVAVVAAEDGRPAEAVRVHRPAPRRPRQVGEALGDRQPADVERRERREEGETYDAEEKEGSADAARVGGAKDPHCFSKRRKTC